MANPVTWVIEHIKKLNETIWNTPLSEISKGKTFLHKQLKIILLATRGFTNDKIQLRASALTFYSLLSVIPVAAIAFAIAKGFGLDENLHQLIFEKFQSQQEVLTWMQNQAQSALNATRGGYIAGIGMMVLIWSVMSLLNHIEDSFNHIWQIRAARPWYRKFADYITIMLIAPIFIILSSSITVFISTQLNDYMAKAAILEHFKPLISLLFKLAPYVLTWITLTILFIIMPNAKVKFVPAMTSAIIAGTILQVLQWLYIDLQFGITKLSAIYGSFAAVPLFIVWLQSSWIIVLLGAEISFANQNLSRYELESETTDVSQYQKRALILMVMHMIICNFTFGGSPLTTEYIAANLNIPVKLVREILQDLTVANLVCVIHQNDEIESSYHPATDINKITVSYALSKLDRNGSGKIMVVRNKDYEKIIGMLDRFDKMIAKSEANILIKDL